ncbi:hypothetical protein HO173_000090 [Letharia columbiana]|uniref:Uncharacterized protein n=1 Tax=Letharia columbiana TaxID=112416 RepID=A0A8H6G6N4_9LECA|nr:uncharacterized protein HO173_000090 [Letharia columbiana]KAF6241380.1 hypothetical protein HO173_000090 [Letharia columbiana]
MEDVGGRLNVISQRALPPGVWDKVCSRLLHFKRHLQGNLDGFGQADEEILSLVSELGGPWMGECFEEVVE